MVPEVAQENAPVPPEFPLGIPPGINTVVLSRLPSESSLGIALRDFPYISSGVSSGIPSEVIPWMEVLLRFDYKLLLGFHHEHLLGFHQKFCQEFI